MALTLITTPGATTANAYASLAGVRAILEGIPGSDAWGLLSDYQQQQFILHQTWLLDNCVVWKGAATSPGQALMFPRRGLYSRLGEIYEWGTTELNWTTIPAFIERATAVGALSLATTTRLSDQDSGAISSIAIPGLSVRMGSVDGRGSGKLPLLPGSVYQIIREYAYQVEGYSHRRLVRA